MKFYTEEEKETIDFVLQKMESRAKYNKSEETGFMITGIRYKLAHDSLSVDDLRKIAILLTSVIVTYKYPFEGVEIPDDVHAIYPQCNEIYEKTVSILENINNPGLS